MIVIASHNGMKACRRGLQILESGATPVDAVVEGVTEIEDDTDDLTVGLGGLPNEDGIVELDAAVMDGKTQRGAGIAGLRDVRHAARVARLVMQQTNRCLLVGEGAKQFAVANGFREENLLTEKARRMWLYWKRRRSAVDDWRTPAADEDLDLDAWYEKHFYAPHGPAKNGTVFCAALDRNRDLACATSTSGHAFKISGRVGDSPILGAGLYVDNKVGCCGSIGHGEANLENLSSFLAVEMMRQGATPQEAGTQAVQRIADRVGDSLRDQNGRPRFHLQLFLLSKSGETAGVSLWPKRTMAVSDENGERFDECIPLFSE